VHTLDEVVKSNEVEKQPKADREKVNMQPDCDTKRVLLDAMVLDQTVVIGLDLSPDEEGSLVQFFQKNKDVFPWSAKDLTGVDRSFIKHRLNIDPSFKPRGQKLRKMSDDKVVAVKSEVQRLLDATVIREVMYPKWLANTVPVKKKNGKWRMCIDSHTSTRLHRKTTTHCQGWIRLWTLQPTRRSCPCWIAFLAIISVGWRRRIRKKPSFITPFETFYFVRMSEGLKNAGPTFTRRGGIQATD
jgi:hypothetical protein